MLAAHRIRLAPNNAQATYLARAAGTARFAYNWALAEWQKQSLARRNNPALSAPSQLSLRRQLNAVKRDQFPWMLEVTKNAPQMAIIQLGQAFENFFSKRACYPRFRRKGRDDRFTLSNDQFAVEGQRIRIPKLGWVRMREALRFTGRIVSATIARRAGNWYASLTVDTLEDQPLPTAENQGAVGVDLGISTLATLSTGEKWPGPKALRALLARLRRLSRALSRKVKGASNRACKLASLWDFPNCAASWNTRPAGAVARWWSRTAGTRAASCARAVGACWKRSPWERGDGAVQAVARSTTAT